MRLHGWTTPGGTTELALRCGPNGAGPCLLVLPALFDEANKTRHFTVEVMHALARRGIASVLPDLPGCNESLAPFPDQTLTGWQSAATEAARQLAASHVLTIRAGALFAPDLPGWAYAPLAGPSALRALLRARILSSREGGVTETIDGLLDQGRAVGLDLAGYSLSTAMVRELADTAPPISARLNEIRQADVGGAGLWLRAEPEHDPTQADALARIIAEGLAG